MTTALVQVRAVDILSLGFLVNIVCLSTFESSSKVFDVLITFAMIFKILME